MHTAREGRGLGEVGCIQTRETRRSLRYCDGNLMVQNGHITALKVNFIAAQAERVPSQNSQNGKNIDSRFERTSELKSECLGGPLGNLHFGMNVKDGVGQMQPLDF